MLNRLFSKTPRVEKYSILVIEDDLPIAQVIADIFRDEGHTVNAAATATDAIKLLETIDMPDAFIIDYMLPDMNGQQFVERVRARFGRNRLPPALMLTASKEGESVANSLQLEDFLPKPFDNQVLVDHVTKLVQHARENG